MSKHFSITEEVVKAPKILHIFEKKYRLTEIKNLSKYTLDDLANKSGLVYEPYINSYNWIIISQYSEGLRAAFYNIEDLIRLDSSCYPLHTKLCDVHNYNKQKIFYKLEPID